jgi:hypothetical protein
MRYRGFWGVLGGLLSALLSAHLGAQGLSRLDYGFPIGPDVQPDTYVVQAYDGWRWTTAGGADDTTVNVALLVTVLRDPTLTVVDANLGAGLGRAYAAVTISVTGAASPQCFLGISAITTTPLSGSPSTTPDYPIGNGCVAASPPPTTVACWSGTGWITSDDATHSPDYQDPNICMDPDGTCCASPIVLNLDGRGFKFTGANDPVPFDFLVTGQKSLFGWTAPDAHEGFLVLDRDGDGTIDNGAELFGNYTALSGGPLVGNGYRALAAFDRPSAGGNGDGVIDAADAVFSKLRVWIDANHDGISQPTELHRLDELGIVRIDLQYRDSRRRDRFGNLVRNWSKATIINGKHEEQIDTCDVIFVKVKGVQ